MRPKYSISRKNYLKFFIWNFLFYFFSYQPKTIFYRALQDNPSAKALGLDLIYYCADVHESSGSVSAAGNALAVQSDVQDIFTEKEVRIRMPIEELKLLLEDEEELEEEEAGSALPDYAPAETESNINMD